MIGVFVMRWIVAVVGVSHQHHLELAKTTIIRAVKNDTRSNNKHTNSTSGKRARDHSATSHIACFPSLSSQNTSPSRRSPPRRCAATLYSSPLRLFPTSAAIRSPPHGTHPRDSVDDTRTPAARLSHPRTSHTPHPGRSARTRGPSYSHLCLKSARRSNRSS